jgi:hypothetical protein
MQKRPQGQNRFADATGMLLVATGESQYDPVELDKEYMCKGHPKVGNTKARNLSAEHRVGKDA